MEIIAPALSRDNVYTPIDQLHRCIRCHVSLFLCKNYNTHCSK